MQRETEDHIILVFDYFYFVMYVCMCVSIRNTEEKRENLLFTGSHPKYPERTRTQELRTQ